MGLFKVAVVAICFVAGGFFFRYGSTDPCDWLVHDWSSQTGIPTLVVHGLVRAKLRAPAPSAGSCVKGWVQFHMKGIDGVGQDG